MVFRSLQCITLAISTGIAVGFTIPTSRSPSFQRRLPTSQLNMHPSFMDCGSLMTAVEVFDGSTIVDPVVVSDVFWTSLKGKIIAVIIGQFLATVAFGILSSLLASQISAVGNFISKNIFKESGEDTSRSTFIRADELPNGTATKLPEPDFGKLLICLAIDVIGSSSELVPILGELTDVVYAPIAATILRNLYGSNILFGLEFAEEILPFTDILPLATLCWIIDSFFPTSDLAKLLKLGVYNPRAWAEDAIDTTGETTRSLPRANRD